MDTNDTNSKVSAYINKNFLRDNWKKLLIPLLAVIVILFIILWSPIISGLVGYDGGEKDKAAVTCGDLKILNESEKTKLPYTPKLSADISGDYNSNGNSCEFFLNGNLMGKVKPVGGKCNLETMKLLGAGNYEISYNLVALKGGSCDKKITVLVGPQSTNTNKTDTTSSEGVSNTDENLNNYETTSNNGIIEEEAKPNVKK